ncbi:hypothetical protein [Pseudanabaena minima]|uniref:hypothetical protein n=1 Tax=Pseudanabaena minima TaxID=890415 RepID=UPI003DA9109F
MLSQSEISQPIPLWVDIIVKLTPSIITLMVGSIGTYIAYNQYRTAKDKLRLDLFEKRLAAYEKLQEYFMFVFQFGRVDGQAIQILGEARYKSRFLFGDDITKHIDEVLDKALKIQELDFKLKDSHSLPIGEERKRVAEELRDILIWNSDQQISSPERYAKYLQFHVN